VYNDHRAGTVTMGGPEIGVTIPSVFILGSDGDALNAAVTADPGMIVSVHCGPESLHMPDPCGAGGITGVDSGQIILGGLENNQLCSWGATCSLDTDVITVTFSAFDIESNWDFLRVYQSADASGDPVASLTGSLPAGSAWTSDGPSASAVYDSDGSVNGPGIVGAWACAPPPPPPSACTASGGVTLGDGDEMLMPPPGESMASNQQCMWTVVCPDGTAPQVTFSAFNIEANWDFLYVDSTGDGAANAQLTGNSIPDVITGSASSNVYMYDSDGSVNRDGFTATVACAAAAPPPPPDPCSGGMALSPGDTFSSPNYPSNYQSNRNCQWTMDCPTGTPTVTFSAFNLENNWDFMHFDLSGNGAADASLTGSNIPDPVTGSAGTQALAVFMSDGSVNRPGFEATFTCP
jgi:cubilin